MKELNQKKSLGACGEELASKYLKFLGWHIIARNHKTKVGEIDIVAREPGGVLVMVEVKTLAGSAEALHRLIPEEHLNAHKLSKLRALSVQFSNHYPQLVHEEKGWRIDLVAINWTGPSFAEATAGKAKILTEIIKSGNLRHYENL